MQPGPRPGSSARAEHRATERLAGRAEARSPVAPTEPGDAAITAAVAALPARQREVCVLHYYLDLSVAEVARGLDLGEGTVKTQLHRARKRLAQVLEADRGAESTDG